MPPHGKAGQIGWKPVGIGSGEWRDDNHSDSRIGQGVFVQSLDVQGYLPVGGGQDIIADADVTNKICENGCHENTGGRQSRKAAREDFSASAVNDLIVTAAS